jgi:hypothetical protein
MRIPHDNNPLQPSQSAIRLSREYLLSFRNSTPSFEVMNQMASNLQGTPLMNDKLANTVKKLRGG